MWLAQRAALSGGGDAAGAAIARVTIGGAAAAAADSGERRDLTLVSIPGIYWLPRAGQEALIIDCAGESAAAGCVQGPAPSGLAPGDLAIVTGSAAVWVRSNGSVQISGSVSVTGTLSVNGAAVVTG